MKASANVNSDDLKPFCRIQLYKIITFMEHEIDIINIIFVKDHDDMMLLSFLPTQLRAKHFKRKFVGLNVK